MLVMSDVRVNVRLDDDRVQFHIYDLTSKAL